MTRIYAFRHGESERNIEPHLIGGQSNSAQLTARGRRQALLAGEWIRENVPRIDFVVSSTAERTQQTGAIALLAAGIDLEINLHERLLEMSQGKFEGAPRADIYTPERILEIERDGYDFKLPCPKAESMREAGTRVDECFVDIAQQHPDAIGLAFVHGTSLRSMAGPRLGLTHLETYRTPTDNLSLSELEIVDDLITIKYIGRQVIPDVPATVNA